MNLGQFHDRISTAIKRGSSLDAVIPLWVSQAARILEQNYTFSWMTRNTQTTFSIGNVPLVQPLSALLKSVNFVQPLVVSNPDGTNWLGEPLTGVERRDLLGISGGNPQGYWIPGPDSLTGVYSIRFDAIPQASWTIITNWNEYTDWPVLDVATPALLLRGEMALFCQTLVLFANEQRDPRMAETYGGLLQGALNTLLRSEEELKMGHQNDLRMRYQGLR